MRHEIGLEGSRLLCGTVEILCNTVQKALEHLLAQLVHSR
jgi:hypothetical protein